jgi:hypothetical protein
MKEEPNERKYVIIYENGRLSVMATSIADARIKADRIRPGGDIKAVIQEE